MRTFFFVTLAIAAAVAHPATYELESQPLGNIIDDLFKGVINGIIAKLPEPVKIPKIDLKLDEKSPLSGKVIIDNTEISGIKDLNIRNISTANNKLSLTVVLPKLVVQLKCDIDVILADLVPLYGLGNNQMEFDNVTFNLEANLKQPQPLKFQLENTTATLLVENCVSNLNGILDDPDFSALCNSLLDDLLPQFINLKAHNTITKILSPIIETVMNGILVPKKLA